MPIVVIPMPMMAGPQKIMAFRPCDTLIWWSTSIFSALHAIRPNMTTETPPITGSGIVPTSAPTFGQKPPTRNAVTAAYQKTWVEYTRVTLMTPMFSAKVVAGGAPRKPATVVATPSPSTERQKIGL